MVIGDDWRTVPAEPDDDPPSSVERTYPPQRYPEPGQGKLPDPLSHWEEVWLDE